MKKIQAVIAPFQLDGVRDALLRAGVDGMSVSEVRVPSAEARNLAYRGAQYAAFEARLKVEVVLRNDQVLHCVDTIRKQFQREVGVDIELAICPVDGGTRIRTGEQLCPNPEQDAVPVTSDRTELPRHRSNQTGLADRTSL